MIYRVTHRTRYVYDDTVTQCYSLAHLLPRNTFFQRCNSAFIQVDPLPAIGTDRTDYFGNHTYHFSVQFPHTVLEVTASSEVEILSQRQSLSLDFGATCADVRFMLYSPDNEENVRAREFLLNSPKVQASPALADYARPSFSDERPFFSCVRDLTERIYRDFTYDPRFTEVATPLEEVLQHRRGVCQDFAHLAIGCLRSLGYPQPRLVLGLFAGGGLGGFRPHQQPDGHGAAHHHRLGQGLRRRHAPEGVRARRRQQPPARGGRGRPAGGAAASLDLIKPPARAIVASRPRRTPVRARAGR